MHRCFVAQGGAWCSPSVSGLVYVIDINPGYKKFNRYDAGVSAAQVYSILRRELDLYQPGLPERALMVLLNKVDTEADDLVQLVKVHAAPSDTVDSVHAASEQLTLAGNGEGICIFSCISCAIRTWG